MSVEQTACHSCDLIIEVSTLQPGYKAYCPRCNHLLSSQVAQPQERALAFASCALLFLLLAQLFPFMAFQSQGREQQVSLWQSILQLLQMDFPFLALLLCGFILIIPTLLLSAYLAVLVPLRQGQVYPWMYPVTRLIFSLHPWGMAEVFLIGVLVSLVKIAGEADLVIGLSFWAYVLFALCLIATITSVDRLQLWHQLDQAAGQQRRHYPCSGTAAAHQLQSCHQCGLLHPLDETHCQRCHSILHSRIPQSLQKTWAYLLTSVILYIPANLYPIMHTTLLGSDDASTILGGVVILWQHGSYPIALIVFFASVMIPLAKMLALFWLVYSVQAGHQHRVEERIKMYRATEFIGRWSMIDVFVVAVLVALVQLGGLVSIQPGTAASAFAGMVILTMLAAQSFDPRMIWDTLTTEEQHLSGQPPEPGHDLLKDTR